MVRVQNVTQAVLLGVVVNFCCEGPVMSHDGPGAGHIQGAGAVLVQHSAHFTLGTRKAEATTSSQLRNGH